MTSVRPDCQLVTPQGWKRAGELRPGDLVFGANGKPTQVIVVNHEVPKRAIAVKMVIDFVTVSEDHDAILGLPWYAAWIGPERLRAERDRRLIHQLVPTKRVVLDLPDADLPLDPWTYGFWRVLHLPDGTIAVPGGLETIALGYLEDIGLPVAQVFRDSGYTYLTSPAMAAGIEKIGDWPGYAPEYLRSGAEQRLELLAGVVDARGRYMNGISVEGPRPIIEQAAELAMSLGLRASMPNKGLARFRMSPHDAPMMLRAAELDAFLTGPDRPGYRMEVPYMIRKAEPAEPGDFVQIKTQGGTYLLGKAMLPVRDD